MKYRIVVIGQIKRGGILNACDFYLKRLKNFSTVEVIELKEAKGKASSEVKEKESNALLKASSPYTIALDEHGKQWRSGELAKHIGELENRSISLVSLLIGGAEGHSDKLKQAVNETWSLSKLTMAHELARLVLLEQLYRIETIRAGHPYHRE